MFPSFWGKQRKLDCLLGCYFFLAHGLPPRVVILQLGSSLSPWWCQPHLPTSLPSPTSNSCCPVSASQPQTMIEQYFNRCTSAGHQNRFFLKKETGISKTLFLLVHSSFCNDIISYCCPDFFFVHPYLKLNWKLISSSESSEETSNIIRIYSSILLRLHVLQRNKRQALHHWDK